MKYCSVNWSINAVTPTNVRHLLLKQLLLGVWQYVQVYYYVTLRWYILSHPLSGCLRWCVQLMDLQHYFL